MGEVGVRKEVKMKNTLLQRPKAANERGGVKEEAAASKKLYILFSFR